MDAHNWQIKQVRRTVGEVIIIECHSISYMLKSSVRCVMALNYLNIAAIITQICRISGRAARTVIMMDCN